MRTHSRVRGQFGSASIAIVVVGAVSTVMVMGLVIVGRDALDATRAQGAADATALAGVIAGPNAASRVAVASEARVSTQAGTASEFDVVVVVGEATAAARARRLVNGGGVGQRAGLAPAMLAALARADQLLGRTVPIVSGFRSYANQVRLWDERSENPFPVAVPGTSRHELGLAIDVSFAVIEALVTVAADSGLCHPLPESDPVHFIVCPTRR